MNITRLKSGFTRRLQKRRWSAILQQTAKILARESKPVTSGAESCFDLLQSLYPSRPEYGYDSLSVYRRASERVLDVLKLPGMANPGLRGLDLAAGDGMLAVLLHVFGHVMTLTDLEDWRADAAKDLTFVKADCCNGLPIAAGQIDFVLSYNSFEHFADPTRAFEEVLRVLRPGGLMHFQFNPLYCSPWGLHAYRMLRMPYPQFLFSEAFTHKKLTDIGIWDLGKKRTTLQPLNRWKPSQFEQLWARSDIEVISCRWHQDNEHLSLVQRYPESFQGRGLRIEDLVRAGVTVSLRKK